MKLEFINEADTLDWVGSDYKQGMARYNADTSFRRGGVTYFIEFLDPFGSNMLAKWWDNSDNGVGYNNQGWVFVDNQFDRMTGSFSPENIDKYIKVDSDYGRKPPLPIQRILIDKVKRQLDYDALNNIKRIGESTSMKFMKEWAESYLSESDKRYLDRSFNEYVRKIKNYIVNRTGWDIESYSVPELDRSTNGIRNIHYAILFKYNNENAILVEIPVYPDTVNVTVTCPKLNKKKEAIYSNFDTSGFLEVGFDSTPFEGLLNIHLLPIIEKFEERSLKNESTSSRISMKEARVGKMKQVYVSQEYVPGYGWEDVTEYDDMSDESYRLARHDVKDYRDNGYQARWITRRIQNKDYVEPENNISYDEAVAWFENECPYDVRESYFSAGENYVLGKNGRAFAQVYIDRDNTVRVRNIYGNRTKQVRSIDEMIKEIERIANL